ncbi:MAG: hypothetical protein U0894_08595 [Pirellulales bacterium]
MIVHPQPKGDDAWLEPYFDAIKEKINWNFELEESNKPNPATAALPGTREKLTILATRLREGHHYGTLKIAGLTTTAQELDFPFRSV